MKNLVELYCDVDDFCKVFVPQWQQKLIEDGSRSRHRECRLSMSEIMTIIIGFHMSHHRDFKNYYRGHVKQFYKKAFPDLLSYTRFLAVIPRTIAPKCAFFTTLIHGTKPIVVSRNEEKEQWVGFTDSNYI